jgi:hypothetical protein
MDALSENDALDAATIVEQLRSLVSEGRREYPRSWMPRASYEDLVVHDGREPIHLHESIYYLHRHWNMADSRSCKKIGWGPQAIVQRLLSRIINGAMSHYFAEEQMFRSHLARSIDAIAYRVDNLNYADQRALLGAVREDLIELACHVDNLSYADQRALLGAVREDLIELARHVEHRLDTREVDR